MKKSFFLLTVAVESLLIAIPALASDTEITQKNLDISSLSKIQLPAKSAKLLIQQYALTEVVPYSKIEQVAQIEKNQPTTNDTLLLINFARDCVRCGIKYPLSAKQRGIEGSPEVAIDYDENGKVTSVRLIRSSGHSELDEALIEQAREFQLKPTPGGKQGVRVVANFHIRRAKGDV